MSCLGRLVPRASACRSLWSIGAALLALLAFVCAPAGAATITTHSFLSSFDGSDSTTGAFGGAGRVAVSDATGNIYAIDTAQNVVAKFDASGAAEAFTSLELPVGSTVINGANTTDGSLGLGGEADIAVDNSGTASDGNIYVDSESSNTVYGFDSSGTFLFQVGGFGDAGGIAVDSGGKIWVAVANTFSITQYDATGTPTGRVLDTSAIEHPCHFALDSSDNFYVNMWQAAVEKFDASGAYVGRIDDGPGFGVAVDRNTDHVLVNHVSEIVEHDAGGSVVTRFGSGRLSTATGVAVDSSTGNPRSGNVVVSDDGAHVVDLFGPLVTLSLPDVTTGVPSNVGPTSARISGIVNPNGSSITCSFEYGTDTSYGSSAPCSPAPGSGSGDVAVHADLSGLTPGTTYHYRLAATSADGTSNGSDATFTTPQAPTIGGGSAIPGSTGATLKATVNPQGAATTYHFEYGTDTSYGTSAPTPDASAGSSSSAQSVSVDVTGLQPSTTYHFRVVATNVAGTTNGSDHTFTTSAPVVADTCPNAHIRAQQGASMLPDCRAWELVSQADKGQSSVVQVSPLSTDGSRVMYDILGGGPGTTNGARAKLLATRTAAGWVNRAILPPSPQLLGQNYFYNAVTPDLSAYVASAFDGLGSVASSPNESLVRVDDAGNQTLLHTFPTYFGSSGIDLAASDDLQHVYANVPEAIAPSHQPGTSNLYDFGSGTPTLVGTLPATDLAPTCGVEQNGSFTVIGFIDGDAVAGEHWTSADGNRVFFQTRGDDAPACDDPLQLYAHDLRTGRSTLLSGPPVGGDPDNGVDRFIHGTPDGSVAFFRTATSLTPDDDTDGNASDVDIYRWTAASGQSECITCAFPQADVLGASAVSDDGSHVYFSSVGQYDGAPGGASSSSPNSYVWRAADDSIHFVAPTSGVTSNPLAALVPGGEVTPDGGVLVFASDNPALNAISRSDNGGTRQLYRYDDGDGSVTCVSCPPDGSPATANIARSLTSPFTGRQVRLRVVSDDGSTIVFRTTMALVTQDRNGAADLYSWRNGQLGLITSGTATLTIPTLAGMSADGRDVLFLEIAQLTADARDRAVKLYDARIDGGFAVVATTPPCVADQCRGPVSGSPALADPPTDTTDGDGNVRPAKPARFTLAGLTARQRAALARTGRVSLRVHVNKAGSVSATARAKLGGHMRTVATASKRARGGGTVTLRLQLSRAARQRLADGHPLRVVIVVRFAGATGKRLTVPLVPATADGR
jgi:hypothetical protein